MAGINANILYSVVRIRASFVDDIGNVRRGVGTGFWLRTKEERRVLVTNRHVLDASMVAALHGLGESLRMTECSVEQRLMRGVAKTRDDVRRVLQADTRFARVTNIERSLICAPSADCAILAEPALDAGPPDGESFVDMPILRESDLADETWLATRVDLQDHLLFIGFPGRDWWDTKWNLPVVRHAVIASAPWIPFSNAAIRTADTLLVSGFSFGGSSGSPLLSAERGIGPGDIHDPYYNPVKLIGIMSGHINEQVPLPALIDHTGLSYATRSTSILDVVKTWRDSWSNLPTSA